VGVTKQLDGSRKNLLHFSSAWSLQAFVIAQRMLRGYRARTCPSQRLATGTQVKRRALAATAPPQQRLRPGFKWLHAGAARARVTKLEQCSTGTRNSRFVFGIETRNGL
jgi:hypothetical protein